MVSADGVSALRSSSDAVAIGDRLGALKWLIDFIKGLGLDAGELLALVKEAVALFKDFDLDKALAFLDKLFAAIESKAAIEGEVTAAAIDPATLLMIIQLVFDLIGRFRKQ